MIQKLFSPLYLMGRRAVRGLVIRMPWLDRRLGKWLVRIDGKINRLGPLEERLAKGMIQWRGLTIYFRDSDKELPASLIRNDDYEPETREALTALLEEGGVFVDVGAHIGFFTLWAARLTGETGKVYAFEPTPRTRETLVRNVMANDLTGRVAIEPLGVSSGKGTASFLAYDRSQCNAMLTEHDETGDAELIHIETTSLDAYFEERGWPRVDAVKLDIEGQELNAIQGMRTMLEKNPRAAIIFEFHLSQLDRSETDPGVLFQNLKDLDFRKFSALFRKPVELDLPAEMDRLMALANRANLNILCER